MVKLVWANTYISGYVMHHSVGIVVGSGGCKGAIAYPPKTYESNFIHHDFVQIGKQHSRYNAILPFIVLSQKCYDVYFNSLAAANP